MKKVYEVNVSDMQSNVEMLMLEFLDLRLNYYTVKIIFITVLESKFKFEVYYDYYYIILEEENNVFSEI